MTTAAVRGMVWQLTRDDPPSDADLLSRYVRTRENEAFAELLQRHGPVVLGVCRRLLANTHDAEDAFQAVFLVLARKAPSVQPPGMVGNWLYGVAVRTANKAKLAAARRWRREMAMAMANRAEPDSRSALELAELRAAIDRELGLLPEKLRAAVVLCDLGGKSRSEAARELGCPEGTITARLHRARKLLAERLTKRGIARSATGISAILTPELAMAAVAPDLARATMLAAESFATCSASAAISPTVQALAEGVMRTMTNGTFNMIVAAVVLAGALTGAGVLWGAPNDEPGPSLAEKVRAASDEPKPGPGDPAAALVRELGDPDFPTREAAGEKLRKLGVKARPALEAALRDPNPEIAKRSREVLTGIRADARDALAKQFDPTNMTEYDHPVWKRFVAIAGDSRASRELFARIIANKKWLQTLDIAEADPALAGHVYRVGIAEIFRDFDQDPAKSPPWPCDRPEEVAYLLLLGSHPDKNPPAKLVGDEVVPTDLRGGVEFLGRGIIFGEGQITHANGLDLGLEGKWLVWQTSPAVAGTDRVFAKLFAAWFAQRTPSSGVVPRGFLTAFRYRVPEILPLARRYAANDFEPKRDVPPLATIAALELVAQLGTRADLPLFERHFGDETKVAAIDKPRDDGARDYYRPAPLTETTQLRDVALGLALLLHGGNPADFGFVVRKDAFKQIAGRYEIPWYSQFQLGFPDEARRTAAFTKAKAWLAEQKPAAPPEYVVDVQFSPDGQHMVMVAGGKVTLSVADLKAWQIGFGPVVLTMAGEAARFTADGKSLVVMGPKAVTVHDAATGKETKSFPRPKPKLNWHLVSFSPDGKRYAAHFGFNVGVYDTATGFEPFRLDDQHEPGSTAFPLTVGKQLTWSPDGKQVVAVGVLVGVFKIGAAVWDAGTGKRLHAFEANSTDGPRALAFSSDSKQIAVGFAKHVSIFDAATFKEVKNLGDTPGSGPVTALAFSPDGKLLAVGFRLPMIHGGEKVPRVIGHKTEVQLLDLATGKELQRFDGFEGVNHMGATVLPVTALAFSPDGKKLAAGTGLLPLVAIPDGAPKAGEVMVFNIDAR